MSYILYYSNFCEPSKKILQAVSKTQMTKDIHFICIDNRIKEKDGKIYIVLQGGNKIILPENVTRVPALLLLHDNYRVIFGDDIYQQLKPQQKEQQKIATQNNMEPLTADAFGGFSGGLFGSIASDNYSFLDQNDEDLSAKGNGGLRQMHNYVSLDNFNTFTQTVPQEESYSSNKIRDGEISMESLQKKRDQELVALRR